MINQGAKFQKKMLDEYAKIIYRRIDEDIQLEEIKEQGKLKKIFTLSREKFQKCLKKWSKEKMQRSSWIYTKYKGENYYDQYCVKKIIIK